MGKGHIKNEFLREEIKAERRHLRYLLNEQGKHPLEVAEEIITDVISLLKEQIKQRHPSLSEKGIKAKMREKLALERKNEGKW